MVQLQRYLKTTSTDSNPLPYLNSLFVSNQGAYAELGERPSFSSFVKYIERSPQVQSFVDILVSDIVSDDIKFVPMDDSSSSGRNRKLQAKQFWTANKGIDLEKETIRDLILFGIAYNWTGKIDESSIKELCKQYAKRNYEAKEVNIKAEQIYESIKRESPQKFVKKLRLIAASTVSIQHDGIEVTKYIQRVGNNIKEYKPEDVICFKFMPFNGGIYPLCPIKALFAEIYLIWLISQNYISFFENGGNPDKAYILPKEIANSKNHQYLIETLQKYKKIQNKHGNLVFTGEIRIEDLMKVESQMDHQNLALYVIGVLALYYKVPAGRIPFLIGKSSNSGDAGGLADAGYWRQISVLQSTIEEGYNSAIFNPYFKVDLLHSRGYKQDEVRETQIEMQKTQVAEQRISLGLWTSEYAARKLDVPDEVYSAAQTEKKQRDAEALANSVKTGMLNQNLNADKNVAPEPDKQKKNDVKRNTQNENYQDNPDRHFVKERPKNKTYLIKSLNKDEVKVTEYVE